MGSKLRERNTRHALVEEELQAALRVAHVVRHQLQQEVVLLVRQARGRVLRLNSGSLPHHDRHRRHEGLRAQRLDAVAQCTRENQLESTMCQHSHAYAASPFIDES